MASTSERATGGVADLRADVLEWLRSRPELTARLEWIDTVDDGAGVIRPVEWLRRQRRADGSDPPDVTLTVEVYTTGGERHNFQTEKNHSGQVMLTLRERAARQVPGQWGDDVRDEIVAALTLHRQNWYSPMVPGGDTGLSWNDQTNREEMAISFEQTHRQW